MAVPAYLTGQIDDVAEISARRGDGELLERIYTDWLHGVLGRTDVTLECFPGEADEEDATYTEDETIWLREADFPPEPSSAEPRLNWLCEVHSTVWHEVGHLVHMKAIEDVMLDVTLQMIAGNSQAGTALNALEDTRQERLTIEAHPEARGWLKFNIERGASSWLERARLAGQNEGWAISAAVFAARTESGVLAADDLHAFRALNDVADATVTSQQPLWRAYAALTDGQLATEAGTDEGIRLVGALAKML